MGCPCKKDQKKVHGYLKKIRIKRRAKNAKT